MDEMLSGSLPKSEMWPAKQQNLRLDVQLLTASVLGAIRDLCISAAKRRVARVAECQYWKLSRRQATPFELRWNHKVKQSEKAQPTSKRVDKIIHYLTYKVPCWSWYNELIRWWYPNCLSQHRMNPTLCSHGFTHRGLTRSYLRNAGGFLGDVSKRMQVYRYMNRGLYERDKMLFKLLVTLKIMTVASQILGKRSRRMPNIHKPQDAEKRVFATDCCILSSGYHEWYFGGKVWNVTEANKWIHYEYCIEETKPIRTSASHTKQQFLRITSGDVAILLKASINGMETESR